jgi:hypothetical protein
MKSLLTILLKSEPHRSLSQSPAGSVEQLPNVSMQPGQGKAGMAFGWDPRDKHDGVAQNSSKCVPEQSLNVVREAERFNSQQSVSARNLVISIHRVNLLSTFLSHHVGLAASSISLWACSIRDSMMRNSNVVSRVRNGMLLRYNGFLFKPFGL